MAFRGIITPLITPFNEKLEIDFEALRWLAYHQLREGVHGIFPNSTTGEFVHLEREEAIRLTEALIDEVGGKIWVIPGISHNSTDKAIELGSIFKDMGVDGVIVTPPFFFKIDAKKLKLHFSKIAERVDLPIIIYNIPSLTGINVPIELYIELAQEYNNIAGAKVTYDSFSYLRRLIQRMRSVRKDFSVLTGMDDMLLSNLMMGGDGGITALANVTPGMHRSIYDAWADGDLKRALDENHKLLKLSSIYDIASSFPTAIKTALNVMGAPVKPYVRPPLTEEPDSVVAAITEVLRELGLCD